MDQSKQDQDYQNRISNSTRNFLIGNEAIFGQGMFKDTFASSPEYNFNNAFELTSTDQSNQFNYNFISPNCFNLVNPSFANNAESLESEFLLDGSSRCQTNSFGLQPNKHRFSSSSSDINQLISSFNQNDSMYSDFLGLSMNHHRAPQQQQQPTQQQHQQQHHNQSQQQQQQHHNHQERQHQHHNSHNHQAQQLKHNTSSVFWTPQNRIRRTRQTIFSSSSSVFKDGDLSVSSGSLLNADGSERYSRKVFVGGLPPDIDEEEIRASFSKFGPLFVDWPHKAESKSYFPPKGYAFLLFQEGNSVQSLINACIHQNDKLYLYVSSPTTKDKLVQIRPWKLADSNCVIQSSSTLDPRRTVFVGGVPRPLKASELAEHMDKLYGGVCYAGIDVDPDLKYPKGAGRVAFDNQTSYLAAISHRFVQLHHSEFEKRVEVKPYVLDDQVCDACNGIESANKFAPFFCASISCLRYYCEYCWNQVHKQEDKRLHKPLVKESIDRPRGTGQASNRAFHNYN